MPDQTATLAQKVRTKYPHAYDDLSDLQLEDAVTKKYPGVYDDLPRSAKGPEMPADLFQQMTGARPPGAQAPPSAHGGKGLGQQVSEGLGALGETVNPIPALAGIGEATLHPSTIPSGVANLSRGYMAQNEALFNKSVESFKSGDYVNGMRTFANYLLNGIPGVGATLEQAGTEMQAGDYGKGIGRTAGLGLSIAVPERLARAGLSTPGVLPKTPNPTTQAAIQFGERAGIPVDAATATGNKAIQGMQALADRSLAGSVVARGAKTKESSALTRTGEQLAGRAHPSPIAPEQAGQGVLDAIKAKIAGFKTEADTAYSALRAKEGPPPVYENEVVHISTPENVAGITQGGFDISKSGTGIGGDSFGPGVYLSDVASDSGSFWRSELATKGETGRAPTASLKGRVALTRPLVVEDVAPHFLRNPDTASAVVMRSMPDQVKAFDAAIANGTSTNQALGQAARSAGFDGIVIQRSFGDEIVAFNPASVTFGKGSSAFSVNIAPVKAAMQSTYEALKKENALVPLQGDRGRALVSLDRLMEAPDTAPLSVADKALGDLKRLARVDDDFRRTAGQGVAAKAVINLEQQVRGAAAKAGVTKELMAGRAATVNKYKAIDVLDKLNAEPVRVFNQAVWQKDAGIARLREAARLAPQEMPKIGRAYLDDLLNTATKEGEFERAARLKADWDKLGPETKKLLFPTQGHVADLDNFFLLAKKLAENPNPSGTGYTNALWAQGGLIVVNPIAGTAVQIGAGALSKLLHSPRAVKVLTRGLQISPSRTLAAATAAAELAAVAKSEGIALVPALAQGRPASAPTGK